MVNQGDSGRFRVRVGAGTTVAADVDGAWFEALAAEDRKLQELLLHGIGHGLVGYARGHAVLHGSSVSHAGKGLGILGPSGQGKSTLCASLCRESWEFVSDVMIVVEPETRRLLGQQRRWRLRDDSLIELGELPDDLPIDDDHTRKRRLLCDDVSVGSADIFLERVVVLKNADMLELVELGPVDAILALVTNSYVAERLEPDPSAHLLRLASALQVNGVRVFALGYPHRWDVLKELGPVLRSLLD